MNGRGAFTDAVDRCRTDPAPPVAFDPATSARIDDCPSGSFSNHVSCWNFADFRRRPYGLGVRSDVPAGDSAPVLRAMGI